MFTLMDKLLDRNCSGFARREFLRAGSLGMFGGLTLPNLLQIKALAKSKPHLVKDKAVVLLFLQGGPPHIEFFDPKMTAPSEFRSITGEIPTTLPGITFGSTFPKLAKMAHKLAVVRSYASGNSGHTYLSVTSGGNPMKAAMSAVYSRVAGTNHPTSGIPSNVLLLPEAVQQGLKLGSNFETGALPTLTSPGSLGQAFEAFNPAGGGPLKQDMELCVDSERLQDRKSLLGGIDQLRRDVDASGLVESADEFQQQAFDVIGGGVSSAFDFSREDKKTLELYDTQHIFRAKDLQRWGDMRRTTNLLGLQMLMARRMVEAGTGFVTVSDCGWDYHANNNSPKNMAGIHPMGHQVDHAVAAFLTDLGRRGLSEKVLLVVTGEMGRSPRINKNGGRDHYGNLTSLLIAGGGLKMGQVIGDSDKTAAEPATRKYGPMNLLGTIFHTLFDMGELRIAQNLPASIREIADQAKPIPELV
jgi:hypothetical protein